MTCTHTCIISWLCASFNAVNMVEINCDTHILNTLEKKNETSNLLIKYLKNESIKIITCKTKMAVLRLNQDVYKRQACDTETCRCSVDTD